LNIYVASRATLFDVLEELAEPVAVISIYNPDTKPVCVESHPNAKFICYASFDDMDDSSYCEWPITNRDPVLFDETHARKIWNFVDSIINEYDQKTIVVQCDGGVSRSSAVAAALKYVLTGSDRDIFNDPRYIPNSRVYRMMMEAKGFIFIPQ